MRFVPGWFFNRQRSRIPGVCDGPYSGSRRPRGMVGRTGSNLPGLITAGLVLFLFALSLATAQVSTAFTYQGYLEDGGEPANGQYNFQFVLVDSETGTPSNVSSVELRDRVLVDGGIFSTELDFGSSVYALGDLWLEISVQKDGVPGWTLLTPRQKITPTPVANYALDFDASPLASQYWSTSGNTPAGAAYLGTTNAAPLTIGVASTRIIQLLDADDPGGNHNPNIVAGSFANRLDDSLTPLYGATVVGGGGDPQSSNCGPNGNANCINTVAAEYATVVGGQGNYATGRGSIAMGSRSVSSGSRAIAIGASVTASGRNAMAMGGATTASGSGSTAMGSETTAGGSFSTAMGVGSSAIGSGSVAMGSAVAEGNYSTGMGLGVSATADGATAAGSLSQASGTNSVAMGDSTTASGASSIAMGASTTASGEASTAMGSQTSAGGDFSVAMGLTSIANGFYSVAIGRNPQATAASATAIGWDTTASGVSATAVGAFSTASGEYSMALGRQANAVHDGSFVWSDSNNGEFSSTAPNQFLLDTTGGVGINTASPATALHVRGPSPISAPFGQLRLQGSETSGAEGTGAAISFGGHDGTVPHVLGYIESVKENNTTGDSTSRMSFYTLFDNQPLTEAMRIDGKGNVYSASGSFTTLSDRRLKRDIEPIEGALEALLALEGVRFRYRDGARPFGGTVPRMGFVAQQVEQVLPEWVDESTEGYKQITPIGFRALTVEAMRELHARMSAENERLREQNRLLTTRLSELEARNDRNEDLEARLALLESLLLERHAIARHAP